MRVGFCIAVLVSSATVWAAEDPHAARVYDSAWTVGGAAGAQEWSQDAGAIDPTRPYIVECRYSVNRGVAWLKATLLDAAGAPVNEIIAKQPMPGASDRWFALQTPPTDKAVSLRVSGGGDAEATFSGLRVLPFSPRILGNADFALPLDRKNRIPMWNEETLDALTSDARAGAVALDAGTGRLGNGSVTLTPAQDWCALSSINYPVPTWSDRFRGEAWVKCAAEAEARAALIWSDDAAINVLRVDVGEAFNGDQWIRATTALVAPPEGARMVRVAVIARHGQVTVDDADFVTEPPAVAVARVLANQAGYDEAGPKSAIIMTNALPEPSELCTFNVAGSQPLRTKHGSLQYAGRMLGQGAADWGWYFWRADFSDFKREGEYAMQVSVGTVQGASRPFEISPDRLFLKTANTCVDFFFVQRCGCEVPGWHKPCHMDDAKLPDGTHRDLTGGWHSAGDYNKTTWEYGDGGVTYALATLLEAAPDFCARFNRDQTNYEDAMDEAIWGAQYLSKQQMDNGGFYKDIQQGPDKSSWMKWSPPDSHTDNVHGTPDDPIVLEGEGHSPLAIGAWARLSVKLGERQKQNDYLERAIKAWGHAAPNAEGDPLLLISTVDLFTVTKDEQYRTYARASAEKILASAPKDGMLSGGYANSGDVPAAALAHFALVMPGDPLKARIKDRLKSHLDAFLSEPRNAFGISQQQFGPDAFFFEPTSTLGHNYEYCCRAWSALKVYQLLRDRRAWEYAVAQLDFVLGKNPYDLCMMEGIGTVNPPRYHHRYKTIPNHERGNIPGEIPNGFVRDMAGFDRPGFDLSMAGRDYPSYRTSEPWLVHNVFYLLAVSALNETQE